MRNLRYMLAKELRSLFVSPIAYVVIPGFLILSGFFFYDLLTSYARLVSFYQIYRNPMVLDQLNVNDFVISPLFQNINVLLLLIIPLITMRLFAEEKRQGTDELLFTLPIRTGEIVLGKALAAVLFFLVILVLTAPYPIILAKISNPDLGKILSAYLGLFLMGVSFISLGLFASSLTDNQIIAAVLGFSALLLFWIVGWIAETSAGALATVLGALSLTNHFEGFAKGVLEIKDLVYFITFIGFWIFLTLRSVESVRWR
ncbi:MAG TPA: ABC transporter permease [Proteobacteria bacterium]|nr:ABC transporter permease [Pseudomonadota bacterium]